MNYINTVLVENSDERLAAVEEAKRTGQPFQSVAANPTEVVSQEIAQQIAEEHAATEFYVGPRGHTYAAHIESYHEKVHNDPDFVPQTNEEKAAAHAEYSAQFVRDRMAEEAEVQRLAAEGFDPSLAVQQANLERAREHEGKSADYELLRQERQKKARPVFEVIDEVVRSVSTEELGDARYEKRAEVMTPFFEVPKADEAAMRAALVTKDKIIEAVEPYQDHAMSQPELRERDHPGFEILQSVGSPEELRERTALAQAAANNPTPEAAKALEEVSEKVAEQDDADKGVGETLREAEFSVNDGVADEMKDNPKE